MPQLRVNEPILGINIKAIGNKPRDASPRDPREGNKRPLDKKQKGPEEK
jgi:hypothetical protein